MIVHVLTMVPALLPKTDSELSASPLIQELREVLRKKGGEAVLPIMMGDTTVTAAESFGSLLGPFDILITKHKSTKQYNEAKMSDAYQKVAKGKKILTFGFTNNTIYNDWVIPALKKIHDVVGKPADTDTKLFVDAGGKVQYELYQTNGDRGLENYKRRLRYHPGRHCYLLSLNTKLDTPDGRADDHEYNSGWHKAAFRHDIQTMLAGNIVSLDRGPKMFGELSISLVPSREVFVKLLESDFYIELSQIQSRYLLDQFTEVALPLY